MSWKKASWLSSGIAAPEQSVKRRAVDVEVGGAGQGRARAGHPPLVTIVTRAPASAAAIAGARARTLAADDEDFSV